MSDQQNDLERMLSAKYSEPKDLPLSLLKEITNSFSDEQEIGRGGFAVVYKGRLKDGMVAVKRLHNSYLHEDKFKRELECLIKVKHINVVRFLGHCDDTQKIAANSSGKFVLAEVLHRLLCFEYLPRGSLCHYITALEWTKCYVIIEGICQGLNYLHENNIVHSDMKPANILLDSNMIPKIADFGLSECFDENETLEVTGSRGYMAPEYGRKEIPFKYDIYSLGVIIIEIITGERGHPDIENVLQSWTDKLEISCTRIDPTKRPDMKHIIAMLDKTISTNWCRDTGLSSSTLAQAENASGQLQQDKSGLLKMPLETCLETTQETGPCAMLLDIHPPELRFPFRPNELITCPAYLKNITEHCVAFRLQLGSQSAKRYYHDWFCGHILPGLTYTLNVTMKEWKKPPPSHEDNVLIIQSTVISHNELQTITEGKGDIEYVNFFTRVQEKGIGKVHEQKLAAVCDKHGATKTKIIPISDYNKLLCMDVHPTKPWIITSHFKGPFRIWDHETTNMVHEGPREQEGMSFWMAKFIERKQLIVAGGGNGCIYMYNYNCNTMEKVKSTKAHRDHITSLAIHPTKPYVLSVSKSHNIKLWDWEEGMESAQKVQIFKGHHDSIYQITFNLKDADTFATVSKDNTIKIWSLDSPHYILTIPVFSSNVRCLDYFTRDNEQYLITGSEDGTAKIWDLQKKCCIETLDGHTKKVSTVCYHPMLQLLVTGSWDGTVRLWNSNSFRLEGIHNFGLQKVHALGQILKGSGRVLIGYRCGLAIMAHEGHVASNSENTM